MNYWFTGLMVFKRMHEVGGGWQTKVLQRLGIVTHGLFPPFLTVGSKMKERGPAVCKMPFK
jgi:hypothetical protein